MIFQGMFFGFVAPTLKSIYIEIEKISIFTKCEISVIIDCLKMRTEVFQRFKVFFIVKNILKNNIISKIYLYRYLIYVLLILYFF